MQDNQPLNPSAEPTPETPADPITTLPDAEADDLPAPRSKKWYILGGIVFIFLAAAVFFGAQLLKASGKANQMGGEGGPGMVMSKGGPGGGKSVRINMNPAPEMPQEQPTTTGIFVRREDQSIFIGTGNIRMMVKKPAGGGGGAAGGADVSSKYDGPVVEVVVNHQTKVYQDITEMMPPDATNGDTANVQQKVKEGSLDDLGQNMVVSVWGEKQGDRFIAKVISFR